MYDEVLPVVAIPRAPRRSGVEEMGKSKLAGPRTHRRLSRVHDIYENVAAAVERPLCDLVLAHTGGNQLKAASDPLRNRSTRRKKLATSASPRPKASGREDRALDGD